jgi:uracil-DNA glycosylase family 4
MACAHRHIRPVAAHGGPDAIHGARLRRVVPLGTEAATRRLYAGAVPFIDHCHDCPYQGKAIGPRGHPDSRIILVGEAPGATEIVEGEPFRGRAGQVLSAALVEAGLVEADLFITNSVACRPRNPVKPIRTPSTDSVRACRGRLVRDISAHDRAIVVALGATAIRAVTGLRGFLVTKKKPGTELPSDWGTVVPTLHPAYVLRRGLNSPEKRLLVEDLRQARRLALGPGD